MAEDPASSSPHAAYWRPAYPSLLRSKASCHFHYIFIDSFPPFTHKCQELGFAHIVIYCFSLLLVIEGLSS